MKEKGFTLIELLAVIVILAIIALIATPIILGIIKDSKKESDKRSIEMYADALKNSIAQYQLGGEKLEVSTLETTDGRNFINKEDFKVDYDGDVVCKTIEVYEDGNIYLAECEVNGNEVKYTYGKRQETLAQYITNLYNNSTTKTNSLEVDGITYSLDTTNGLMDDRLGGTVESGGNIRYYGKTPNNYIDIGDKDASGNVILWRIIGVFKDIDVTDENGNVIKTEDLVKIIRADSIGTMAWDSGKINNWSTATLNKYLNTSTYYPSLNSDVTSKIENVKWNISSSSYGSAVFANDFYVNERATETKIWSGKVALMYPSDYGYGADLGKCNKAPYNYSRTASCIATDWLLDSSLTQWTLNPNSSSSYYVFCVFSSGYVVYSHAYYTDFGVRPALYLKSDVSIVGEGTTVTGIKYYVVE